MVVRHTLMHLDPENLEKARESYKSEEFTWVLRKLKRVPLQLPARIDRRAGRDHLRNRLGYDGRCGGVRAERAVRRPRDEVWQVVHRSGRAQDVRGVRVISASSRTLRLAFTDLRCSPPRRVAVSPERSGAPFRCWTPGSRASGWTLPARRHYFDTTGMQHPETESNRQEWNLLIYAVLHHPATSGNPFDIISG